MDINTKIQIVANQHNRSLVSKYTGFFFNFELAEKMMRKLPQIKTVQLATITGINLSQTSNVTFFIKNHLYNIRFKETSWPTY